MQDDRRRYPYKVVLIGGGMAGEVHAPLFDGMEPAFARPFHRPTLDPDLDSHDGVDPVRLILADGLARDPNELRAVAAMPRDRPARAGPCAPEPITKDQV